MYKCIKIYFLGANLRSGEIGIFPIAHVVDVEYNDFDPDNTRKDDKKERHLLDYIGMKHALKKSDQFALNTSWF